MSGTVHWAYVCGASPERFPVVQARLAKDGINVSGHCPDARRFNVPKHTTLLLLISDMVDHNISDKARAHHKATGIPLVAGLWRTWSTTRERLDTAGILAGKSLLVTLDGTVVESREQPASEKPTLTSAKGGEKLAALKAEMERPAPPTCFGDFASYDPDCQRCPSKVDCAQTLAKTTISKDEPAAKPAPAPAAKPEPLTGGETMPKTKAAPRRADNQTVARGKKAAEDFVLVHPDTPLADIVKAVSKAVPGYEPTVSTVRRWRIDILAEAKQGGHPVGKGGTPAGPPPEPPDQPASVPEVAAPAAEKAPPHAPEPAPVNPRARAAASSASVEDELRSLGGLLRDIAQRHGLLEAHVALVAGEVGVNWVEPTRKSIKV